MRWTKEEEILTLRLYLQVGRKAVSKNHPGVIELSNFLRREPSSIAMRTANFVAADAQNPNVGLSLGSKQTRETWRKFCDNPSLLESECERIRREKKKFFQQREEV